MHERPLISVLTWVRNGARTIQQCLDSVQALEHLSVEHVIQDGASTDGTFEILEKHATRCANVKLVSERDSCGEEAFFRGLKRCRGEIILTCLADESLLPGASIWAVKAFEKHPAAGAVYGDLYLTDENGNVTGPMKAPSGFTVEKYLLHQINPPFASSAFKRSALEAVGLHTHEWALKMAEFEFWVRIGLSYPVYYVSGFVANYAIHRNQLSSQKDILFELLRIRRDYLTRLASTPEYSRRLQSLLGRCISGLHFFVATVLKDAEHYQEAGELLRKATRWEVDKDHFNSTMLSFFNTGEQLRSKGESEAAQQVWSPVEDLGVKLPHFDELRRELASLKEARRTRPLPVIDRSSPTYIPRVTVIVVSHNYGKFLESALGALARQTFQDFEVILIDDGSTDGSEKVARELAERFGSHFSVRLELLTDVGPSKARTHGISLARGVYYVPMDADDKVAPTFLERTVAVLDEYPDLGYAYTDQVYFGDRNERVSVPEFDLTLLARGNFVGYCSLVRKSAFLAVGGYDPENWGYYEDWDLWLKLGEAGWQGKRVPEPLFIYNYHFGSSLSYFARRLNSRYRALVLSRHPKLYSESVVASAKAELSDMYAGWHALPPMRSVELITSMLEKNPGNSHLLYFLAEARRKKGDKDGALAALEELLRLHPGDEQATQLYRTMSSTTPMPQDSAPAHAATFARRIVALLSAYNEGDVIYHVIGDLIANGLEVYLLDNNSSDNTVEEASRWLGKGLIKVERFPDEAGYSARCSREYVWKEILSRKEEIAATLDATWFLHVDADEFRESPWPGKTLAEAIWTVEALGYNALNFELFNFRPIDDGFVDGSDVRDHLDSYEHGEWFNALQIKAWRNTGVRVQLAANGGHSVMFPNRRVFPLNFVLRHYPIRGERHGRRKVFQDRLPRFAKEEVAQQWHIQYNDFVKGEAKFLHDSAKLVKWDGNAVRAKILGRFAEDQLLVGTLSGTAKVSHIFAPTEVCAWVGRRLGMPGPINADLAAKLENTVSALLPTQAQGFRDLPIDVSPAMGAMLYVVLEAKLVHAKVIGDAHFATMANSVQKALLKKVPEVSKLLSTNVEVCSPAANPPKQAGSPPPAAKPSIAPVRELSVKTLASAASTATGKPAPKLQDSGVDLPPFLASVMAVAEFYSASPDQADAREALLNAREKLSALWFEKPVKVLEGLAKDELFRRAFRALLDSGASCRIDAGENAQGWLAELRSAGKGKQDVRKLLAVALHMPAHRVDAAFDFSTAADPVHDLIAEWWQAAPKVLTLSQEPELYHKHFLNAVRAIHSAVLSAPQVPATLRAATAFANRANCLPIFLAAENTREAMTKRAAIFEYVLKAGGARVDATLPRAPVANRKLRVGYLAAHFSSATESHVTMALLGLSREKFESVCFSLATVPGAVEAECRKRTDQFVVLPQALPQQVEALRNAKLDALVICTNVTAVTNQIVLIASHRLAPVQIVSYASPMTTGLRHADYFLAGSYSVAESTSAQFSERLLLLDGPPGSLDYRTEESSPEIGISRGTLEIPEGAPVFVNAASCFKIRPETLDTWARILKQTEAAHLVLLPFNPNWAKDFPEAQFVAEAKARFEREGVDPSRVHLVPSLASRAQVLTVLKLADVYLDTFPFAGSIAVIDALQAELPVVTCAGTTFRSRFAAALLREIGFDEAAVPADASSYEMLAVELAMNPERRRQDREKICSGLSKGPRFLNSDTFTQNWQLALEDVLLKRKR
jgi:predicted O-linked N-acetylglucosamine transferase (SPINDLY family)/glycosyltransferase involved in cell wall biosynthesis